MPTRITTPIDAIVSSQKYFELFRRDGERSPSGFEFFDNLVKLQVAVDDAYYGDLAQPAVVTAAVEFLATITPIQRVNFEAVMKMNDPGGADKFLRACHKDHWLPGREAVYRTLDAFVAETRKLPKGKGK